MGGVRVPPRNRVNTMRILPTTTVTALILFAQTQTGTSLTSVNLKSRFNNNARVPLNNNRPVTTFLNLPGSKLYTGKNDETILRDEIVRRSTDVEGDGKYGVADGSDMDVDRETLKKVETTSSGVSQATVESTEELSPLQKQLKRALKPRAYPLFLMEKTAIGFDDLVDSVFSDSDVEVGSSSSGSGSSMDGMNASTKEHIVVLGTGWGSAAFLKDIDADMYDVTVISPRNFFLFTPMLAGASVGTVEYRSITEPIREINRKVNYLEGTAIDIDTTTNTILCEAVTCEGNSCTIEDFNVQYDRLVFSVGAQTNTFGIPGVKEYCNFLKQVEDAKRIRTSIVNLFERANLPNLTDEQRQEILTFAIIGAGPTGIEFASELRDFVEYDGPKYYPSLLKHVRIKVIEASSSVLAPFDKSLQDAAMQQLTRTVNIKDSKIANLLPAKFELTELLLDSGVSEVKQDVICLNNGKEIPYGLAVWAAGNGPLPITLKLIEALGEGVQADTQNIARGRLAIDHWLRVLGGDGKIFALGDCSCIVDGVHPLPATAQVASQQGEYLARLMSKCSLEANYEEGMLLPPIRDKENRRQGLTEAITAFAMNNDDIAAPFQFLNLGILAYTGGGSALAQFQVTPDENAKLKGKGKIGYGLWRSVYLAKQVSWRNRFLVFTDWVKAQLFGRDITRVG